MSSKVSIKHSRADVDYNNLSLPIWIRTSQNEIFQLIDDGLEGYRTLDLNGRIDNDSLFDSIRHYFKAFPDDEIVDVDIIVKGH